MSWRSWSHEKVFSWLPTIPWYRKFARIFYKKQTSLPLVRNYGLEGRNDNPLSFLQSTLKLDESQTLNLRKLSYVGGLTSKGQVSVLLGEHRGWILRVVSYKKRRGATYYRYSHWFTYSILLSTGVRRSPPFSPERETCCMLPICGAFAFLRFLTFSSSTILPYAPTLWN